MGLLRDLHSVDEWMWDAGRHISLHILCIQLAHLALISISYIWCVGFRHRRLAAALSCVCPFGQGPATELGQRACFLWPSTMGITIPVPCEKIAAVRCRLLSPSQVTLGWGSCQGFIIFTSDKLSPCEIFSGAKERCKDHFWEWLLSSAVCVST